MSTNRAPTDDLIDFNLGSPELPRSAGFSQPLSEPNDNLIDSELPVLERKLQNAPKSNGDNQTKMHSDNLVDVEDILIDIDDNIDKCSSDPLTDSTSSLAYSHGSVDVLDGPNIITAKEQSESLEALDVLMQLDEMLSGIECEKYSDDGDLNSCNQEDESIEECLKDLDLYLQKFDVTDCYMDVDEGNRESLVRTKSVLHSLAELGVSDTPEGRIYASKINKELVEKLREQLVSGGKLNFGYEDDEDVSSIYSEDRPLSSASIKLSSGRSANGTLTPRSLAHRKRLQRGTLRRTIHAIRSNQHQVKDCHEEDAQICSTENLVVKNSSGADSDEEIDWSWVQDVARDISRERLAHATTDRCTGNVTVEPLQRRAADTSPLPDHVDDVNETEVVNPTEEAPLEEVVVSGGNSSRQIMPEEAKGGRRGSTSWLRSSMRRLRPLPMPNNGGETSPEGVATPSSPLTAERLEFNAPEGQDVHNGGANNGTLNNGAMTSASRPFSAPSRIPTQPSTSRARSRSRESRVSNAPGGRARSSSASSRSRRPRSLSSSVSSLASSVDSSPSSIPTPTPIHNNGQETPQRSSQNRRSCDRGRSIDIPVVESPLGQWPHSLSSMLACLGCTLGLFNISRFAILSVHFGANFIFQFILLSFLIGLPLFTLQLCLGQQLGAGVIDMWRISPLFQGVGISLLAAQAMIGLYSITGVSWMFVYFRDSFITKMDHYKWAEPFPYYRNYVAPPINGSFKLSETVPDYLSGVVFQRHNLVSGNAMGTIKFQPAFNLAVIWMIIFVSLSKGLRSYGKVVFVFTLIPVFGMFVLCAKILGMMPPEFIHYFFPETSWDEFFRNSKSWLAAGQEVFLTWGLLGAAAMQIASHNKNKHLLRRDSTLIAIITLIILLLAAFLANTCIQIMQSYNYSYQPDSFEKIKTYGFMRSGKEPLPPSLSSSPVRYMIHHSFILGNRVTRTGMDYTQESGYQVLRLATELVPATFALLGTEQISPFWAVLFYFILILFGIAQQLAIWHCLITGIMAIKAKVLKSWETTITFFSCACGFVLGLPMTTEFGIYVVYFLDLTVGGCWWLILVILMQIVAVFMVRGRPYSGDTVVTALFKPTNYNSFGTWAPGMLSFTWNVILPVGLTVLCITTFKNGNFRELFVWHHAPTVEYWPLWARQVGSMIQLLPVLCIPLVAVIQSYRYLNNGPPDILDRIQLLYRPPIGEHMEHHRHEPTVATINNASGNPTGIQTEDPPPKYTPPPSYTTATGARLAKMLRQSIRRSVRRIANALGESSNSRQRNNTEQRSVEVQPPDYNAVLVEMNQSIQQTNPEQTTVTDGPEQNTFQRQLANIQTSSGTLTAADVASILRNSFRRSTIRANTNRTNPPVPNDNSISSLSAENLVENVAPIGETSLVLEHLSRGENERDLKPQLDNLASVI